MILSMSGQAWHFLAAAGVGAVIGLVYDLFRILRKTAPHSKLAVQAEDLLFWLGVTLLMFYFILSRNDGEMRWFSLLGAGLGGALYFAALSRFIVLAAVAVIEFIKKVIGTVIDIILKPFRFVLRLALKPARAANKFLRKHLRGAAAYGRMKIKKTTEQIRIIRKKV